VDLEPPLADESDLVQSLPLNNGAGAALIIF